MAENGYIGIDGKARKIKKVYIGVNGIAREVTKAYVGVSSKAQQWFGEAAATPTYTLTFGSGVGSVKAGTTTLSSGTKVAAGTELTINYGATSVSSLLNDEIQTYAAVTTYTYTLTYKNTSTGASKTIINTTGTFTLAMPSYNTTISITRESSSGGGCLISETCTEVCAITETCASQSGICSTAVQICTTEAIAS